METFLDVLEANPELTTLIIHNAGPRGKTTTSPQSSTVRQVKLDHLTRFELSLGNRNDEARSLVRALAFVGSEKDCDRT